MRPVRWSADAEGDLQRIVGWIAERDGEARALAVLERLAARVDSLATMASRGRRVPEVTLPVTPPLREIVEDPWRIVYVVDAARVLVVAIVDARRDMASWLQGR